MILGVYIKILEIWEAKIDSERDIDTTRIYRELELKFLREAMNS